MGGADRCAVYNCNNDRRYKDRLVIKDHVKELKWHSCPVKCRRLWGRLINRADLNVLTDNTRVCSNHFVLGRPYGLHPHPSMYLKGYEGTPSHMNNAEIQELMKNLHQRKQNSKPKKAIERKRTVVPLAEHDYLAVQSTSQTSTSQLGDILSLSDEEQPLSHQVTSTYSVKNLHEEHAYDCRPKSCTCIKCDFCEAGIAELREERDAAICALQALQKRVDELEALAHQVNSQPVYGRYSIEQIENSNALMLMHTGVNSYGVFQYTYYQIEPKLSRLQYYKGTHLARAREYPQQGVKKPGLLSHENELLTLIKWRLNLTEHFLGHLFGVSVSLQ